MAYLKTLVGTFILLSSSGAYSLPAANGEKLSEVSTFKVCGNSYKLEVAKTNAARSRGLMYRTNVPKDEGMIFVFAKASPQNFWMKNVPIPLDILFFDSAGKIINSLSMSAESPLVQDQFLKQYASTADSQFVVELRHGTLKTFSADKIKKCRLEPLYKIDKSVEI